MDRRAPLRCSAKSRQRARSVTPLALSVGSAVCARSGQSGGNGSFDICVAPSMIAKSAPCTWVTIHTNVPLGQVQAALPEVNGVEVLAAVLKADARGNTVVKIRFAEVIEQVQPPSATIGLTLVVDGDALFASEVVTVKE